MTPNGVIDEFYDINIIDELVGTDYSKDVCEFIESNHRDVFRREVSMVYDVRMWESGAVIEEFDKEIRYRGVIKVEDDR